MRQSSPNKLKIPAAVWAGFKLVGVSVNDVVRHSRLSPSVAAKGAEVTTAQYFALWRSVLELSGDAAVGIKLAAQLESAALPPAFLAGFHAADYRDALHRVARFKQLCAPEHVNLAEDRTTCAIDFEWIHAEEVTPAALIDASMASVVELGRRGTRLPLKARLVELARSRGSNVKAHEAYYGCRVRVGAKCDRLVLTRSDLDHPFATYNEELLAMLAPELTRALEERQPRPIAEKVVWILKRRMSGGRLDLETIAGELGVSERTLQRRITEAGTSYQHLVTEARQALAREYLADVSLELKEVASLLGYSDQNSFFRAFRQWEGATPSEWRAAHRAPSSRRTNDDLTTDD